VIVVLNTAGGALLKGELMSDETDDYARNADLQPSVHWDQNAYDVLVKQEGLRKKHAVRTLRLARAPTWVAGRLT
jgi:hypothetical protein